MHELHQRLTCRPNPCQLDHEATCHHPTRNAARLQGEPPHAYVLACFRARTFMPKHSSNMQDCTKMSCRDTPRVSLHIFSELVRLSMAHSACSIIRICCVNSIMALPLRMLSAGRTRAPMRWKIAWVVSSWRFALKLPHTPSMPGCADIST